MNSIAIKTLNVVLFSVAITWSYGQTRKEYQVVTSKEISTIKKTELKSVKVEKKVVDSKKPEIIQSVSNKPITQTKIENTPSSGSFSQLKNSEQNVRSESFNVDNENETNSNQGDSQSFPKTISNGTQKKVTNVNSMNTKEACLNRIAKIDSQIEAIDTKVNYIESDQTQKEEAINKGWFREMSRIKAELVEEKSHLTKKLSTLK
jgi:hypothetical protein